MIRRPAHTFLNNQHGMALVEFAIIVPALLTLVFGVIEVTRYILITQKVEKLAHTVADITAQSQDITTAGLTQILEASAHVMDPYALGSESRVIISSLHRSPNNANGSVNPARVTWCFRGAGTFNATSRIGAFNAVPTMPGGFTFNERENVISAEVFYRFSPLISTQFFGNRTIYRAAFYKPRLGELSTATVSCN